MFMKKLRFLAPVILLLSMSGCVKNTEEPYTETENYLEQIYGKNFTFEDSPEIPESDDICYTFSDDEGIECHVYSAANSDENGDLTYYTVEDYQVAWLESHPELYSPLTDSDRKTVPVWDKQENYIHSVRFTVYFENYDDIEPAVSFVDGVLSSIPKINDSEETVTEKNLPVIHSESPAVDFCCPYLPENSDTVMFFPFGADYENDVRKTTENLQNFFSEHESEYVEPETNPPAGFSTIPE